MALESSCATGAYHEFMHSGPTQFCKRLEALAKRCDELDALAEIIAAKAKVQRREITSMMLQSQAQTIHAPSLIALLRPGAG
jgi:ribosomal protein L20A (L18A)